MGVMFTELELSVLVRTLDFARDTIAKFADETDAATLTALLGIRERLSNSLTLLRLEDFRESKTKPD